MKNLFDSSLLEFIEQNPTAFQVVSAQTEKLDNAEFCPLLENEKWYLEPGGKYYVTRNGSALIAFQIPETTWSGYHISASHADSPCFKLKVNPEMTDSEGFTRLNVELYGGAVLSTWFDRPLSVAGRICIRDGDEVKTLLVDLKRDLVMIPSLAIHMNRTVNEGYALKVQKDLLPVYSLDNNTGLLDLIAEEAGVYTEDILSHDLYVYNRQKGVFWGKDNEFMSSPRLDDVMCAYASLEGFLASSPGNKTAVHVVYDNEETGSSTKQGAASTFLKDVLTRISESLHNGEYLVDVAGSFMLSMDNAHAFHPNYPEKCDPVNRPKLGGGVVIKYSANQKYTTDAVSSAYLKILAQKAGIKLEEFVNHSDIPGGSTLGNLSGNQVAVPTVDIGIAQLAMHSSFETCGCGDAEQLMLLVKQFFQNRQ